MMSDQTRTAKLSQSLVTPFEPFLKVGYVTLDEKHVVNYIKAIVKPDFITMDKHLGSRGPRVIQLSNYWEIRIYTYPPSQPGKFTQMHLHGEYYNQLVIEPVAMARMPDRVFKELVSRLEEK